jgi:hypothetical protein
LITTTVGSEEAAMEVMVGGLRKFFKKSMAKASMEEAQCVCVWKKMDG